MKKIWFKAKRYGWGWTPITWEGWAVIVIYVYIILVVSIDLNAKAAQGVSVRGLLYEIILRFAIPTLCLIVICYYKGEKPGWRWGDKSEDKNLN